MKRFLCIFAAAALMLVLSSCGMTAYEDADSYFKISFPESMKVFVMNDFSPDDPALEEYGIDADEMSNFKEKEGGIFYAKDNLGKSCSVAINGSDTTIDIWELKKSDSDTVIDLYKQIASSFNGAGYAVIAKTEVDQGDAHYIYIEFSSKGTDIVDTIYMTTVKNGLQYSIMYTAENMTENDENEAHSIFDTAFITKTISNTETDEQAQQRVRNATLAIIAIVILIAVVVTVAFVKHAKEKKRKIDNGEYVSQFKDKE